MRCGSLLESAGVAADTLAMGGEALVLAGQQWAGVEYSQVLVEFGATRGGAQGDRDRWRPARPSRHTGMPKAVAESSKCMALTATFG